MKIMYVNCINKRVDSNKHVVKIVIFVIQVCGQPISVSRTAQN